MAYIGKRPLYSPVLCSKHFFNSSLMACFFRHETDKKADPLMKDNEKHKNSESLPMEAVLKDSETKVHDNVSLPMSRLAIC